MSNQWLFCSALAVFLVLPLTEASCTLRADEVSIIARDRVILDAISYTGFKKMNAKGEVIEISHTIKRGDDANKFLANIARLPNLERLSYSNHSRSKEGLEHLKNVTSLRELELRHINVTDDSLKHFSGLTNLERLMVTSPRTPLRVTDEGISHLKNLTKLQRLCLPNTQITDKGLSHLSGMTKLQYVYL